MRERLVKQFGIIILCLLWTSFAFGWDCDNPAIDCQTLIVQGHRPVMGLSSVRVQTSTVKVPAGLKPQQLMQQLLAADGIDAVEPALKTVLAESRPNELQEEPAEPAVNFSAPLADEGNKNDLLPNDPLFAAQSQYDGANGDALAIETLWSELTASPVIIAVIDSGIDYLHEDLQDNVWVNIGEIPDNGIDDDDNGYIDDIYGYDFYNSQPDPFDKHMHGTHVAGIIGAVGNNSVGITGMLWDVEIMALRFTDNDGVGDTAKAIEAIHYAVENGARVINLSWTIQASTGSNGSQALKDVIINYQAAGIVFVAASGNGNAFFVGYDIDETPVYPAAISSLNLIAVAATDLDGRLAPYSNYGTQSVHVMAPGTGILSTLPNDDYGVMTGTSAATGFVSATAALLLTQEPELTPAQVKSRIINGVNFDSELVVYLQSGGSLNAWNALAAIETEKTFVPTATTPDASSGESNNSDTVELASSGGCSIINSSGGTAETSFLILLILLIPLVTLRQVRNPL